LVAWACRYKWCYSDGPSFLSKVEPKLVNMNAEMNVSRAFAGGYVSLKRTGKPKLVIIVSPFNFTYSISRALAHAPRLIWIRPAEWRALGFQRDKNDDRSSFPDPGCCVVEGVVVSFTVTRGNPGIEVCRRSNRSRRQEPSARSYALPWPLAMLAPS